MTEEERFIEILKKGWQRGLVNGWEPPVIGSPPIVWAIKEGYLRVTDSRCGFECIKDNFVVWTDAGKRAMEVLNKPQA